MLDEYEWLGSFWLSTSPDLSFPGTISYKPNSGIRFTYFRNGPLVSKDEASMNRVYFIHGFIPELKNITLVASLITYYPIQHSGIIKETITCDYLITMGHFDETTVFKNCSFRLKHIDEFFFPQDRKQHDSYNPNFLYDQTVKNKEKDFKLIIKQSVTSNILPIKPSSLFTIHKKTNDMICDEYCAEIDDFFNNFEKKNEVIVLSKETLKYWFLLESEKEVGISINEFIDVIENCKNLFILLFLEITAPIEIAFKLGDDMEPTTCQVLKSLYLSPSQMMQFSSRKLSNYRIPINFASIRDELGLILKEWYILNSNEFNIAISQVIDHIYGNDHFYQKYTLFLASIEHWSMEYNPKYNKSSKYDWFINNYSNEKLITVLKKYLPENSSSIGEHLSNIRSCIVHPKSLKDKFVQYQPYINNTNIANISEIIFLLLIIAIYDKIGISQNIITNLKSNYEYHLSIFS